MPANHVEFANFLCHFGETEVMLDYLKEIVLPAFTDDTLVRRRGRDTPTEYHLYNVEITKLEDGGTPIIGVTGELIKNVKLVRTQIFSPSQGLIEDHGSMDSSPSAYFCLALNNHQLMYLPKTPHAPSLGEFESTVASFIKKKHKTYLDRLYEEGKLQGQRVTKRELYEVTPIPTVHVVPLATSESVAAFVSRFSLLRSIEFRLLRPNPTVSARDVLSDVRHIIISLHANNARLVTSNPDGLDRSVAISVVGEAATVGVNEITLRGKSQDGAELSGSNEDFKIRAPIDTLPPTLDGIVARMWTEFKTNVLGFVPATPVEEARHQAKLDKLAEEL
jgi:hypothetical protein